MIDFVPKDFKPNTTLTPSIKFNCDGEFRDALIYLDHIPVASFDNETGGLSLLPFELGDYLNGGDIEQLEYLQNKGVSFNRKRGNKKDQWHYTIKVHND